MSFQKKFETILLYALLGLTFLVAYLSIQLTQAKNEINKLKNNSEVSGKQSYHQHKRITKRGFKNVL